jgi:hypothetical protein
MLSISCGCRAPQHSDACTEAMRCGSVDATLYSRAEMIDTTCGVVWDQDGFDASRTTVDDITITIKRGCVNKPAEAHGLCAYSNRDLIHRGWSLER